MKHLLLLISQAGTYKANTEMINPAVSQGSVGWHLQHLLLVISQVVLNVKASNPADYKQKFNFWKLVIFTTKKIPRGKVKAPNTVVPKTAVTKASITDALALATAGINDLQQLPKNHFFVHPIFGKINVTSTITFLAIHTNHHLNIIKDIMKSTK